MVRMSRPQPDARSVIEPEPASLRLPLVLHEKLQSFYSFRVDAERNAGEPEMTPAPSPMKFVRQAE